MKTVLSREERSSPRKTRSRPCVYSNTDLPSPRPFVVPESDPSRLLTSKTSALVCPLAASSASPGATLRRVAGGVAKGLPAFFVC